MKESNLRKILMSLKFDLNVYQIVLQGCLCWAFVLFISNISFGNFNEKYSMATQKSGVDVEVQVASCRERAVGFEKQNRKLRSLLTDHDTQIKQLNNGSQSLNTKVDDVQSKYGKTFIFFFTFLLRTKFTVSI